MTKQFSTDQVVVVTPDGGDPYPQGPSGAGLWVFRSGNFNNNIQYNQIAQFFPAVFDAGSAENQNCVYSNWQENGAVSYTAWWDPAVYFPPQVPTLPNTVNQPCVSWL
ncbi:MAG TPA: hypothetical protein VI636_24845 [Candidatus Angelobacter sp.]